MTSMRVKYEEMKQSYEAKNAQLRKVKQQNLQLLNMAAAGGAGSGGSGAGAVDGDEFRRLQELLEGERAKNKLLADRIKYLEENKGRQEALEEADEEDEKPVVNNILPKYNDSTVLAPSHTKTTEYAYL